MVSKTQEKDEAVRIAYYKMLIAWEWMQAAREEGWVGDYTAAEAMWVSARDERVAAIVQEVTL